MMTIPCLRQIPSKNDAEFGAFIEWCDRNKRAILSEMQHSDGQAFVSALTFESLFDVLFRFGGAEVYISSSKTTCGWLNNRLSSAEWERLVVNLGPGRFTLPSIKSVQAALHRVAIRAMDADGLQTGEIARCTGTTTRWVRSVRARLRTERTQGAARA